MSVLKCELNRGAEAEAGSPWTGTLPDQGAIQGWLAVKFSKMAFRLQFVGRNGHAGHYLLKSGNLDASGHFVSDTKYTFSGSDGLVKRTFTMTWTGDANSTPVYFEQSEIAVDVSAI